MSRCTGRGQYCSSCRVNWPSLKPCPYSNRSEVHSSSYLKQPPLGLVDPGALDLTGGPVPDAVEQPKRKLGAVASTRGDERY